MAAVSAALLKKELRQTLRGRAAFIMENLYLLTLVGIFAVGYLVAAIIGNSPSWSVGGRAFWAIMMVQGVLVFLVAPSLTAPSLTMEREQKTYDVLASAPLRAGQVVWSKMLSSGLLALALIVISIPVTSVCFMFGGVAPAQFGLAYLSTLLALLVALAVGMYCSGALQRTIAAVPLSIAASGAFLAVLLGTVGYPYSLAMISPINGLRSLQGTGQVNFFRWDIPFWIPAALLSIQTLFWLGTAAAESLKHEQHRQSVSVRAQFLALCTVASVFSLGSLRFGGFGGGCASGVCPTTPVLSQAAQMTQEQMSSWKAAISAAIVAQAFALWALIPLFCAGRFTQRDNALLTGAVRSRILSLSHWLGSGVLAGIRYLALLWVVTFAATMLSVLLLMPRVPGVGLWPLIMCLAVVLSTVWAFAALARLPSFWRRLRGNFAAKVIASILVVIVIIAPLIAVTATHTRESKNQPAVRQILEFTVPFAAIEAALAPKQAVSGCPLCRSITRYVPFPLVTTGLYLVLAGLLAAASVPLKRRYVGGIAGV